MANTKIETITQTQGFGNDYTLARGYRRAIIEYHRSSGIMKSKGTGLGMMTTGVLQHLIDFLALVGNNDTPVSMIYNYSKSIIDQAIHQYVLCNSSNGNIIQSQDGITGNAGSGAQYLHRTQSSHAYFFNLIVDPKGRTLYLQDQFLGMFDPNSATPNDIAGTVAVTNGSNAVVGTGTAFNSGMVGKSFMVLGDKKFYKVSTYTDATHITLTVNYTGTNASGVAYIINSQWNDSWKDFGGVVSFPNTQQPPHGAMDIYEDTVIIGRANNLVTLNVVSDTITTDSLPALNFPVGYSIDHVSSNETGILLGLNTIFGKGVLALWDNYSTRSISPWIWFNSPILSISKISGGWVVITARGIYTTNGITATLIKTDFLDTQYGQITTNYPWSSTVLDNQLIFGGIQGGFGRRRAVLYRFDLGTKLVEAVPRANLDQANPTFLQMVYSSQAYRLFVMIGGSADNGIDWLDMRNSPLCSNYVSSGVGQGDSKKVADRIRLTLKKNSLVSGADNDVFTFTVAAKISTDQRSIYNSIQVKSTSPDNHTIVVDTSTGQYRAQVGDEVEFWGSGNGILNNAGYCRNIKSISGGGTNAETWTLDSDFPSTPQANQVAIITPFQLINRFAISVTNGIIAPLLFSIKNSQKSQSFMIKIDIEDNTKGVPIEFEGIDFLFDDLGQI